MQPKIARETWNTMVRGLVLVPLAADEVAVRVVHVRPLELAALDLEREVRQVRAGQVGREVGGREEQRAVNGESHHPEYQQKSGARLRRRSRSCVYELTGMSREEDCQPW